MSTIKSSSEHLTLNADGASKDIKFQANGVEKASISSAGAFTSTTIDATALTGALPAIDGSSLTGVADATKLPLAGGTMTGVLTINSGANLAFQANGTSYTQIWQTLQSANDLTLKTTADKYISFQPNSTEKLRVTSSGIDVTGAITVNGSALASGLYTSIAVVCDQKSAGSGGGTFTTGAWRTRDINTELTDADGIVSISSNQFTLGAGTYTIEWSAPAFKVGKHQSILYNASDSSYHSPAAYFSAGSNNNDNCMTHSLGTAVVTITGSKAFEIRHNNEETYSGSGFGQSSDIETNTYLVVKILKHS